MVSANTPAAMASMIACRLLPLPDIKMTSLEGMAFFLLLRRGNGMSFLDGYEALGHSWDGERERGFEGGGMIYFSGGFLFWGGVWMVRWRWWRGVFAGWGGEISE